jgi:hypothetical protein
MHTRKNRFTLVSALALVTSLLIGCAPQMTQTPPPNADGQSAAPAKNANAAPKVPPPTVAECKTMAQKAGTNVPATSGTDVQKQFDDAFQAYQDSFRCCFDALYAPQAPRMNGQVALDVKVSHEGKLLGAEVLSTESNITMPEMHTCMIDIAKTMTYPKPANDSAVDYKRVFQFKARR